MKDARRYVSKGEAFGGGTESPGRTAKRAEVAARAILDELIAFDRMDGGDGTFGSEAELIERYGLARSTLREALRILEVNGAVRLKSGRSGGVEYSGVSPEAFSQACGMFLRVMGVTYGELMEARLILEPQLVALAAERQNPALITALGEIVTSSRDANLTSDRDYLQMSRLFHDALIEPEVTRIIGLFARALNRIYSRKIRQNLYPVSRRHNVKASHERIFAAITAGDSQAAATEMREHMDEYADFIRENYPGIFDEIVEW